MRSVPVVMLAATVGVLTLPATTSADETIVFPWFLELSGGLSAGGIDTNLVITYTGVDDPNTVVNIYIYDQRTGQLLEDDTTGPVCGPCPFPVGLDGSDLGDNLDPNAEVRMRLVNFDELITQQNGGSWLSNRPAVTGFIVVVVEGDDPELVHISGVLTNAKSGPLDVVWLNLEQFRMGGNDPGQLLEQIGGSLADLQDAVDQLPTRTDLADEIGSSLAVLEDAVDQLPTRTDLADELDLIASHLDEQDALLEELKAFLLQILDQLPGTGRGGAPGGP